MTKLMVAFCSYAHAPKKSIDKVANRKYKFLSLNGNRNLLDLETNGLYIIELSLRPLWLGGRKVNVTTEGLMLAYILLSNTTFFNNIINKCYMFRSLRAIIRGENV